MTSEPPVHPHTRAPGAGSTRIDATEIPVTVPEDFPTPRPSTGTVDDDDEPEDEHESDNEACEGKHRDDTELPEELEHDDEDRTD